MLIRAAEKYVLISGHLRCHRRSELEPEALVIRKGSTRCVSLVCLSMMYALCW